MENAVCFFFVPLVLLVRSGSGSGIGTLLDADSSLSVYMFWVFSRFAIFRFQFFDLTINCSLDRI